MDAAARAKRAVWNKLMSEQCGQMDERMAQHSTHQFHDISTQSAACSGGGLCVETARNRRIQFIDKNLFPMSSGASE